MRAIGVFLIISLAAAPVFAQTLEAYSLATPEAVSGKFLQQFDIVFWQTLPFAALWGHFFDRQISAYMFPGSSAHWQAIASFAVAVSTVNAYLHARRTIEETKPVD